MPQRWHEIFPSGKLWPKAAIFVRPGYPYEEVDPEILPTYGWYGACTPLSEVMAAKMPSTYSEADRNWQWPEKTWFQERLNSIKAREQEQRRKTAPSSAKEELVTQPADPLEIEPLKLD